MVIWSDHETNFVDVAEEIKEIYALLEQDEMKGQITDFCSTQNMQWRYTPEHTPAYGRQQ